jgi:hypothetical protein
VFFRGVEGGFECTAGPDSPVLSVPLHDFSFVSALRWSAERLEFLLTGTYAGRRTPDLATDDKGDLRLYRRRLTDTEWTELHPTYAHDPVHSPELGYAVHHGRGVAFLDEDGRLTHEVKVGRFSWGAPALSVSPSGSQLSWTRWKGDHMKPRIERPGRAETELRTSVARYAWFSDDTMIARNGGLPFLLDLGSGRSTAFARTVRSDLASAHGTPDHLRELLARPNREVWQWAGDLAVHDDRVFFDLSVTERRSGGPRFDGLVSVGLDGRDPEVEVVLDADERFEGFQVRPEAVTYAVATYAGLTVVGRRTEHVGPDAAFLSTGAWAPLRSSSEPSFGSYAPLSTARPS